MKGYLDSWSRYAYDLESKIRVLEAMANNREQTLGAEIAKLRGQLADCAGPRDARIAELEEQVKGLERWSQELIAERQRSMERLAEQLEVPVTNATTMHDLIGQTMTLIAHTKQMFRERL